MMPKIIDIRDEGNPGRVSLDGENWFARIQFDQVYVILADTVDQREDDILATPGLPILGDILRGAFCVERAATETDTAALLWEVATSWDSNLGSSSWDPHETPENRDPIYSWTSETIEEALEKDAVTGDPVVNSAGTTLITTGPTTVPILTINRKEPGRPFNPNTILEYVNTVNATTQFGATPGSALMQSITATDEVINSADYQNVTYVIKFRIKKDDQGTMLNDGWILSLMDQGPEEILQNPFTSQWERFTARDKDQNPIDVKLNPNSTPPGQRHQDQSKDGPVDYLNFNRYRKVDWGPLSLNTITLLMLIRQNPQFDTPELQAELAALEAIRAANPKPVRVHNVVNGVDRFAEAP